MPLQDALKTAVENESDDINEVFFDEKEDAVLAIYVEVFSPAY